MAGVLPFVPKFKVDWKDPEEVDPLIRTQAFEKIVNAIAQYVSSGMATLYPPLQFLTNLLLLPLDEAELILEAAKQQVSSPDLELVQATDANDLAQQSADTVKISAQNKPKATGTSGTAPAGKSGPKTGSGRRRESKAVSTGQKG